jgi:hypothetical protein
MSPEQSSVVETAKPRTVEYRDSPDGLTRTYSNNIALAATRFDVKLIFGQVAEITAEKAIVENRVQVTITWLEAKILADFLQANVKTFEELNGGPLKLPKVQQVMVTTETFPGVNG